MAATYPSTTDQKLPLPQDPVVSAALASVPVGGASSFAGNLQARLDAIEGRINIVAARVEKLSNLIGDGAITGGAISIGTGLSVDITALEGIVGTYVEKSATVTVGGLAPNDTNRLWLRQTGEFTVNQSDTPPSDTDGKGAALKWGQAVTGTSTVTSVSNARRLHAQNLSKMLVVTADPAVVKDGDTWYRSDTSASKARVGGSTVTL